MAKIIRKKKKLKVIPFLILVVVSVLLYFLVTFILNINIKNIYVYNNELITDQEIIELAEIDDYPSFIKTLSNKIENKILTNPYIKDVTVKKNLISTVSIYIEEYNPLFINSITNKLVLENGSEQEIISNVSVPILINSVPTNIYKNFINKINEVNEDIKKEISDIKYYPSKYDDTRFLLYMKDGNHVYINIVKFDNLNYYNEIYPTLNNKKGTLYLDSGNHFEVFK